MTKLRILRKSEVLDSIGVSNTTLHALINNSLFPPSISLGGSRCIGFLEHEVNAVMIARSANYDNERIKDLVEKLLEQREEVLNELLVTLCA